MTPVEIFEYKKAWQREGGYSVRLHSDLRSKGKDFCKDRMHPWQWEFVKYSDNYEDTYRFENVLDAKTFSIQWPKFTNQ